MEQTKFFEYRQNNSGGSFDIDDNLTVRVIVEAKDQEQAIQIGENLGIYFDGCDKDMDCPCCGDRWYRPDEVNLQYGLFSNKEAKEIALAYKGKIVTTRFSRDRYKNKDFVFADVEEYARYMANKWGYVMDKPDTRIFYLDGTVKEFSR
jgi:hypothetical protein